MAKEEPARGPGPCELASGRDWVLRHRPEFEAGLAGKACAVLDQTQDWLDVYRGTRGAPPKTISSSSNGDRNGNWSSPRNTVLRNSTIHDFYGFPDPMYKPYPPLKKHINFQSVVNYIKKVSIYVVIFETCS
ncbi:unnamed protein product [Brassica oleracea]